MLGNMWEGRGESYVWEFEEQYGGSGEWRQGFLEEVHLSTGEGARVAPGQEAPPAKC